MGGRVVIMVDHLSDDLKVACEIWHYHTIGERVWFTKLVSSLAWCMDKKTVSDSMDTLCDWGIMYGEYGETEKGRAGRLFLIDTHDDGDFRIRDLYEKYWKQERRDTCN
jgi:hypothetical protein